MNTKTTKNQIYSILQINNKHYNQMLFNLYWEWVKQQAGRYPSKEQEFLSNPKLFKWFCNEVEILEREFLNVFQFLRIKDHASIWEQYNLIIKQVLQIYPSAIIKYIKPQPNYTIKHLTNIYPN